MNPWTSLSWRRSPVRAQPGSPPTLWRAFAGFGLWAVAFTVLYTGHALACTWISFSRDSGEALWAGPGAVTGLLAALWAIFVFWLVVLSLRSGAHVRRVNHYVRKRGLQNREHGRAAGDFRLQDPDSAGWMIARRRSLRFMVVLTFAVDVASVIITVISGLPIIFTPACV